MAGRTYLGESAGARVFLVNASTTTNVTGSDVLLDVTTWDVVPMGEVGDCAFRTVDVSGTMTAGYAIGITPYIDGVALTEQRFSGSGTGEWTAQAYIAQRGARLSARVRQLSRSGDVELHDVTCSFVPLRKVP